MIEATISFRLLGCVTLFPVGTIPIHSNKQSVEARTGLNNQSALRKSSFKSSAGGGALERGPLSNPRPPDVSDQIMSPALWLPFRGLTKLSHPGKKARAESTAKKHWPKKH